MLPEAVRTERPAHFSVKKKVPSFIAAMPHGSLASTNWSTLTLTANADCAPISADAATPAAIIPDFICVENFILSPCCAKLTLKKTKSD